MFEKIWKALRAIFIPEPLGPVFAAAITNVVDSDSLEFRVGWHKYNGRLAGIDGPEYIQEYGTEAFMHLCDLAYSSRDVKIEQVGYDKYHRMLVRVTVGGQDLALELLTRGCVWHIPAYSKFLSKHDNERYAHASYLARKGRRGLWLNNNPVHPAQFRAEQRGGRVYRPTARQASPQIDLF